MAMSQRKCGTLYQTKHFCWTEKHYSLVIAKVAIQHSGIMLTQEAGYAAGYSDCGMTCEQKRDQTLIGLYYVQGSN